MITPPYPQFNGPVTLKPRSPITHTTSSPNTSPPIPNGNVFLRNKQRYIRRVTDNPLSLSAAPQDLREIRKHTRHNSEYFNVDRTLSSSNSNPDSENEGQKNENNSSQKRSKKGSLKVDEQFSNLYTLGAMIGQGATSSVYICTHKKTNLDYAVKIIPTSKVLHEQFHLIAREIGILQKLNHPSIVKLQDCIVTDNNVYIVMEFVRGAELFDFVVERNRFSEKEARTLVQKMLVAVEYLHSLHIAHRDLKFDNVKLCDLIDEEISDNTRIKILDLGFSRVIDPSQPQPATPRTHSVFPNLGIDSPPMSPQLSPKGHIATESSSPPLSPKLSNSASNVHIPPLNININSTSSSPEIQSPSSIGSERSSQDLNYPPVGTLGYEAPEILKRDPCSLPVDIWAIGVMAYILLFKYPPFMSQEEYLTDEDFLENVPFWVCFNDDTSFLRDSILEARFSYPPTRSIYQVSDQAKDFVGKLLRVNPHERLTASEALNHPWFTCVLPEYVRNLDNSGIDACIAMNEEETEDCNFENPEWGYISPPKEVVVSRLNTLLARRPSRSSLVTKHILPKTTQSCSEIIAARQHDLIMAVKKDEVQQSLRRRPSFNSFVMDRILGAKESVEESNTNNNNNNNNNNAAKFRDNKSNDNLIPTVTSPRNPLTILAW